MSALRPGLYRATVRGVADVTVLVGEDEVAHHERTATWSHTHSADVTNARPLIVLDFAEPQVVTKALRMVARDLTNGDARYIYRDLADAIEAQTKPARIEEPGLWGVVRASSTYIHERLPYIHTEKSGPWAWTTQSRGSVTWADIIDPTLIREGVTS